MQSSETELGGGSSETELAELLRFVRKTKADDEEVQKMNFATPSSVSELCVFKACLNTFVLGKHAIFIVRAFYLDKHQWHAVDK